MTAKRYLKQLIDLEMLIIAKKEDRDKTIASAFQVSRSTEVVKVKESGNRSKHEDLIIKAMTLSEDIDKAIRELLELKAEARSIIDQIEDTRYRTVLTHRYLNCKSWIEIKYAMDYDESWLYRLHGQALQVFQGIMDKEAIKSSKEA